MLRLLCIICLLLPWPPAESFAVEPNARQDMAALPPVVESFLRSGSNVPAGQLKITVVPPDPRLDLPACQKLEAFLPPGARLQGHVTVGVRCLGPSPWTLYVQAQLSALSRYVVAAVPMAEGHVIAEGDLTFALGEASAANAGLLTDKAQAIGRSLATPLAAGTPVSSSLFGKDWVVRKGQFVRLHATGSGFRISVEAQALANACEGEPLQVKTRSGRVVNGVAHLGGVVEVSR